MNLEAPDTEERSYYVEGYATTFSPYVLYRDDSGDVHEQIHKEAFASADMSDVIMQYDHEGPVLARMSNNTLGLEVRDSGLFMWADLSKTENARRLYEEIKEGMVTQMSWAFTVQDQTFDRNTRTIHVNKVDRVYDVSAVSIPANNQTSISARNLVEAEEEMLRQQKLEMAKKRLLLKMRLDENSEGDK